MKKKNIYIVFIVIFIISLLFDTLGITAYAASATIKFSTESTVVSKGNNVTVSLSLEAEETIGEFEGYISYNTDILEFVEASNFISGGDGVLRISETSNSEATTKKKYTMKFKAREVGLSDINLSDTPMVYNYDEGKEMSVSSNRVTINVKAAKRVSKETSLSDLKISPGILSPKFESDLYEYSTIVKGDVADLVVSATTKDSSASVKVKGNDDLKEGENTITLTVTAESGDKKDYIILVNKEAEVSEETNGEETKDSFKVILKEGKTFIENKYIYELIDISEDIEEPVGYVKTKVTLYGVEIAAYSKVDDLGNDFLLIYAMNEEGESNFYQYDRVEKTMQRYTDIIMTDVNNSNDNITSQEYNGKITQLSIIIAVLSSICVLLILGIIKIYLKSKGYKEDNMD